MPLYEYKRNATNHITLPLEVQRTIVYGTQSVLNRIVALLLEKRRLGKPVLAALDGWYGVDWGRLKKGLMDAADVQGISLKFVSAMGLYKTEAEIENYRQPFVTDDPSFGRVNRNGALEDIFDAQKIAALK